MAEDRDLKITDILSLSIREAVPSFFSSLGYRVDTRVSQTTGSLGITSEALQRQIKHIERLADHENGTLQVYLIEMASVTLANIQGLARALRNRAGNYLLVLTSNYEDLDFVLLERFLPEKIDQGMGMRQVGVRTRILSVKRRNPDLIKLRVLRRFTYTESDADAQYDKLRLAYNVLDWSEKFFNNRALFSDYYLNDRLRDLPEWAEDPKPAYKKLRELYAGAHNRFAAKKESEIRKELMVPVLEALGFKALPGKSSTSDAVEPDFRLFASNNATAEKPLAVCLAYVWNRLLDAKDETRDTETPEENPSFAVVSLLEKGEATWAIVTNGKIWRLYSSKAHSRATNYYEIDLDEALASADPNEFFRYFWLFFRPAAFNPRLVQRQGETRELCFLDELREESEAFAKRLGERLKGRVFEEIFPHFAEGFIEGMGGSAGFLALDPEQCEAQLTQVFHGTLTFLYRLLFLLYAEARDLFPVRETRGYHETSLSRLKEEIAKAAGTIEDEAPGKIKAAYRSDSTALYDRLFQLCQTVDRGNSNLNVPHYNGGLFLTDVPDDDHSHEAEDARFLGTNKIPDRYLALGLDRMARDVDEKRGDLVAIDYKSLGVRQLGSIYEGLLEFKLRISVEKMALVKGKKTEEIVSYADAKRGKLKILTKGRGKDAEERILPRGHVYLENDRRERKATGSYYTPDYIVKYIVEHTVGPVLDEKLEALRPKLREAQQTLKKERDKAATLKKAMGRSDDPEREAYLKHQSLVDELFDLKVLDPAMGSGHFLVEAVDFITDRMLHFLNAFPWNPVQYGLGETRRTILEEMDRQGVVIDPGRLTDVNLLKRHVLKRCIYGVDLNPMAVELAKVSLWLDCFTLGAPLSFLDHHLKYGNSLIGGRIDDVRTAVEFKKQETIGLFSSSQFAGVMLATDLMRHVGDLSDVTADQVKMSRTEFRRASDALAPFRRILDVYTSRWFGNQASKGESKQGVEPTIDFLRRPEATAWLNNPERESEALAPEMKNVAKIASQAAEEKRFFHWELEFPEVYFGPSDASAQEIELKENAGFDAVVGNPPYDVLSEKEREEDLSHLSTFIQDQQVYAPVTDRKIDVFRLFIAKNLELARKHGSVGQIVPMSLLADQQAANLRKYLLETHAFLRIEAFPQKDDPGRRIFVEAKLPTCVFVAVNKPNERQTFFVNTHPGKRLEEISGSYCALPSDISTFDKKSYIIPLVNSSIAFNLAKRLSQSRFVRFGDLAPTFQGEINETTMSHLLSDNPSDGPIVLRGGNIQRFDFLEEAKQGANKFLRLAQYKREIGGERIAHSALPRFGYQRNAALDNWRRLIFGPLPIPCHCFDSVSYLLAEDKTTLCHLAILNSSLQEWRFRLTSSNNHVSTDEIASLPIRRALFTTPVAERKKSGTALVAKHEHDMDVELLMEVERLLPKDSHGTFLVFKPSATGTEEHSDVVHDLLAYLAEQMIDLNKRKQTEQKRFLNWLEKALKMDGDNRGATGLDALTGKTTLRNYLGDYQKGEGTTPFGAITDVLHKNHTRLGISLSDAHFMARLKAEHENSLAVLVPIKSQLARTDRLIDQIVYRLYGLTEEEIAVVEGKK